MPRPITVYPAMIAGLKRYVPDIIHDYKLICSYLLDHLGDEINDEGQAVLRKKIADCRREKAKPQHMNRVYITTDMNRVSLMLVDVDEGILDHFRFAFDLIGPDPDEVYDSNLEFLHGCLWVFEGKELIYRAIVRPKILCELLMAFDKENLIDYNGARYDWKTKHRPRKARKPVL